MLDQGRLARSGVADQAQKFPAIDPEIQMVDRAVLKWRSYAVDMAQLPCLNDWNQFQFPPNISIYTGSRAAAQQFACQKRLRACLHGKCIKRKLIACLVEPVEKRRRIRHRQTDAAQQLNLREHLFRGIVRNNFSAVPSLSALPTTKMMLSTNTPLHL